MSNAPEVITVEVQFGYNLYRNSATHVFEAVTH